MDGWITIGTELSTSKFDRQIADLEKKMQKEEDKKIQIQAKIDTQTTEFEDAIAETDKYAEALERVQKLKAIIAGQNATPEQFTEFQDLTRQFGTEEQIVSSFDKALSKQDKIEQQLEKTKSDYDAINVKVKEYTEKIEQINMQKHIAEVEEAKKSFEGVGKSIQKSIKSISRFALSLIGIRSIYLGIRQMASTLSQYNEDLANKIEAIKLALASTLAPIIEFVVDMLTKAVALLGYVLKMLFGIDIFANASAMSLKKASGSAKELRKQLAGFDEMNVLNADGTTNLGGVSGLSKTIQDMNNLGQGIFEGINRWLFGDPTKNLIEKTIDAFRKMDELIKQTFSPLAQWVYDNVWMPIKEKFGPVIKALKPLLQPFIDAWNDLFENHLKPMWSDFVNFIEPNVIDPILDTFRPLAYDIYNFFVPYVNSFIDLINIIGDHLGFHIDRWEYITEEALNNVDKDTGNTADNIEENLSGALDEATGKAQELDGQDIDIDVNTTQIDEAENGLSNILDELWQLISKPWEIVTRIVAKGSNSLNNFLQPLRDTLGGIGIKLPFLATGGIVNMPNKGTLVGSGALAGEAGREGVIPLTDQQAMAELGREIGKNVLVNLTNITEMNGRVISRELKQVQSEQDFAYNL